MTNLCRKNDFRKFFIILFAKCFTNVLQNQKKINPKTLIINALGFLKCEPGGTQIYELI